LSFTNWQLMGSPQLQGVQNYTELGSDMQFRSALTVTLEFALGTAIPSCILALCIALPDEGAVSLAETDPDELLTGYTMRRAARHLAGRTHAPLEGLPSDDEELARLIADLVARAGRARDVSTGRLWHARLVLERGRLDRAIRRARAQAGEEIPDLARQREQVLEQIRGVVASLEQAV